MVGSPLRHISREERALIDEAIAKGDFRNFDDFQDLAVRNAVAQLRLRKLQERARSNPHSAEQILRESREVRRVVAARNSRRLRLREGTPSTDRVDSTASRVDLRALPTVHGKGTEGRDHDQILGAARRKQLRK